MKLCFLPWLTDPDPPDRMTDEQIEAMAERCFQYMKEWRPAPLGGQFDEGSSGVVHGRHDGVGCRRRSYPSNLR
jgi:hypothetical protein